MRITGPAGSRRLARAAIAVAALGVPAAGAAQASAATIAVTHKCYVNVNSGTGAPIDIVGSGFTPGDDIQISGEGVAYHAAAAADGTINFVTEGPILPFTGPGQKTFALQAQDETAGTGFIATTNVTMANFSIATNPAVAKPTRKVTWSFSGFAPNRTIYVHYLRGRKVVTRMAFGKAKGPCGTLKTKDRFYPGGHPRYSKYTVVFDQVKAYTKRARPRITTTLSFF
ncbi:MAG TPA: hypothetical protein VFN55_15200 [Solirubrobacteraceae bacterium]|nr:hypothetical protein [Solirubrobacteraceae bacterium]